MHTCTHNIYPANHYSNNNKHRSVHNVLYNSAWCYSTCTVNHSCFFFFLVCVYNTGLKWIKTDFLSLENQSPIITVFLPDLATLGLPFHTMPLLVELLLCREDNNWQVEHKLIRISDGQHKFILMLIIMSNRSDTGTHHWQGALHKIFMASMWNIFATGTS